MRTCARSTSIRSSSSTAWRRPSTRSSRSTVDRMSAATTRHFDALFDPRGVVVAGASSHPGKFGFVALHNVLAAGYSGAVFATNLEGGELLGLPVSTSVDDLPADAVVDLAFICTPASANGDVLRACARRGVRAAFVASAGYGEAGEAGKLA